MSAPGQPGGADRRDEYPILEYDPTPEAMIEPGRVIQPLDVPERCVVCFFQEVITGLQEAGRLEPIKEWTWEDGGHPLYEMEVQGERLALFHPGVGAPVAAGLLEGAIALGCRKFIACGGAGVLDSEVTVGHVIVPHAAVRDEGTSYHYLPPGREVAASPEGVAVIERVLQEHGCDYLVAKTWTTDAPYRETPAKVRLRRAEGCVAVEMEAAAFFAVAQFRGVLFAQLLYGGDDVGGDEWDARDWYRRFSVRERLFWLAVEACLAL